MKKHIIENFSVTFISNIVSILISAVITFVVPRYLGVEDYGYYQLYLFYVQYVGFLHLGWADGVFLRYGGEHYSELNKHVFSGQFWLYTLVELVCAVTIGTISVMCVEPRDRSVVITLISIAIIFLLPRTFLQYVLQATNRIKEYAIGVIVEKLVYGVVTFVVVFTGMRNYSLAIAADLLGKLSALILMLIWCRDIVLTVPASIKESLREAWLNISIGIKLMFANVASMLIVGFVRLSIERQWDVTTFGKVSLTISVSNLLMVFINAVALVLFPMLRRTSAEKLSGIYNTMRTVLMIPLLGMLVCYYPAKVILSAWLPQYSDSLIYMALLFPLCVFESKMSMLINTYLKTLRKEKWLLMVNAVTVLCSVITTLITTYWFHNLDLVVASIVFLLAFRCVFAELLLSTVLEINVKTDIFLELSLTAIFIVASWFVGGVAGLTIYALAYVCYLFVKRKDLLHLWEIGHSIIARSSI